MRKKHLSQSLKYIWKKLRSLCGEYFYLKIMWGLCSTDLLILFFYDFFVKCFYDFVIYLFLYYVLCTCMLLYITLYIEK